MYFLFGIPLHAVRSKGGLKQGQWAYSVQVRSVSALGSAMLCQLQWSTPPVSQNVAAVTVCDRALARDFIRRTREDILHQLKTAFRELVVSEQFHHQSCSYFATLGAKRPASDSGRDSDKGDPKGKKRAGDSDSEYVDSGPKEKRPRNKR